MSEVRAIDNACTDEPARTLFVRHLGQRFDQLPPVVARLHSARLPVRCCGEVSIEPAPGRWIRLLARLAGLPSRTVHGPIRLVIEADRQGQCWIRHFPGHTMRSRLRLRGTELVERLGPATLRFRLQVSERGIEWCPSGLRLLSLPLPLSWARHIGGSEQQSEDGRYLFDAYGGLPVLGRLVRYHGWLHVD
ncbi:DUF4166 domain-containing protein [Pseudomarimonas arenosa]|uniref:DUF4166 domain-containing protein n=1 Tax=Pseudomarimonas arenosa TaxID=2774145 RepID=A0AAW3ZJ27_9GAMM|nr:DUF4166 domain-containing protein [Pseudomarimonas arenosa]MBD8525988.1 DUF4166 domain-containing protein [Pseudomarimonas arenosa]